MAKSPSRPRGPRGISCPRKCRTRLIRSTGVRLVAHAAAASKLSRWERHAQEEAVHLHERNRTSRRTGTQAGLRQPQPSAFGRLRRAITQRATLSGLGRRPALAQTRLAIDRTGANDSEPSIVATRCTRTQDSDRLRDAHEPPNIAIERSVVVSTASVILDLQVFWMERTGIEPGADLGGSAHSDARRTL
jgi:hypothetical protein